MFSVPLAGTLVKLGLLYVAVTVYVPTAAPLSANPTLDVPCPRVPVMVLPIWVTPSVTMKVIVPWFTGMAASTTARSVTDVAR